MEDTIKLDELGYAMEVYRVYNNMLISANRTKCSVSNEWLLNFGSFYKWAKNNNFEPGQKIGRKSRSSGYDEENAIIVRNKRIIDGKRNCDRVFITYNGQCKSATDWAIELNIPRTTIYDRIQRGWSDKEVIEGRIKGR